MSDPKTLADAGGRPDPRTPGHARRNLLRDFLRGESGAVTVDWVVLTGFIVALGMATAFYTASSVPHVAERVGEHLENTQVMPDG